jgi:hypothetical protein
MPLLVPPTLLERLGDDICRDLKARGLRPQWVGYNGSQDVCISFSLAPEGQQRWSKAFSRPSGEATTKAFESDLTVWKAKVVSDIRAGKPSDIVKDAIAHYGQAAVLQMLGAAQ